MRRTRLLTIAWLFGGMAVPVAAALVLFGCCELPFHGLVHKVMPLCQLATAVLVHHDGHDHHGDAPAVPAPARPDGKPSAERAWRTPDRLSFGPPLLAEATLPTSTASQPLRRSLPVGAFRCDDDVGTRLAFVETLRL